MKEKLWLNILGITFMIVFVSAFIEGFAYKIRNGNYSFHSTCNKFPQELKEDEHYKRIER